MFGSAVVWRLSKYLIAAEVVCFGGAYYVWHKMNINQEYRRRMHETHPYVLELFYRTAEMGQIKDARPNDYRQWGILTDTDTGSETGSS
ncbi:protein CEBPZOS-like [Asterias rubens]|uniref:protein CEBPZOS-like n=1 Tax=Asterias rubens TaxID=7604 RepID=UPI001455C59D|nr:protein CEBPZOS-like [Asterias rubens]XP_033635204.1 protein CEBPZOS-like [Asterias rubens]XP_033635209.1 protein CEBPZOS-like [Asterias rubens]